MKRVAKFPWIVLPLLLNGFVLAQLPLFFDTPSPDSNDRSSLRDCPQRFYSDVGDFLGPFGGYGGVRVLRGEFQHMVAIGWTRGNGKVDYLCGGSLISKTFVLTAAHCSVDGDNVRPDTVRIGDTDLGSVEDDEFAQQIEIARMINHPQYRGSRKYFDIALIVLQNEVRYSDAVCAACLWHEKDVPEEPMDAIGFGATGFGEELSPTLQRVVLSTIPQDECGSRIAVNRRQMPEGFRRDQFCAAGNEMDTCEGDSGGPIGVKRIDVGGAIIPLVAGVVSFGTPCSAGSTGVYSKVSEFIDWIERETNTSHSYEVCARTTYCSGRKRVDVTPAHFGSIYAKSRFGLLWNENEKSLYECGATLIDYQYFLTTASCVTSRKGHPKYVVFKDDQRAAVVDVYVSPNYTPGRFENDIALIKMGKYINHKVFRPVCLWNSKLDGEFKSDPKFSAFGPAVDSYELQTLRNNSILVTARNGSGCAKDTIQGTDLRCYNNNVAMIPRICSMDYGGPVIEYSIWGEPVTAYGIVSPMSKDCGSNLFMIDVTPHIDWIESIVVHKRDQVLVFSD